MRFASLPGLGLTAALFLTAPALAHENHTVPAATDGAIPGLTTDLGPQESGTYALDKGHANILFGISHLGLSTYFGRFNDFDATLDFDKDNPEASSITVTIQAGSVDVNHDVLTPKLAEQAFKAGEFPTITFTSTEVTKTSDTKGTITGDLTMLGQTKPVTLDVTFNGGAESPFSKKRTLGFGAVGSLKRSEWGITNWAPAVGDTVTFQIQVEFVKHD